jgi:hydroxyethylthiazole kinase
MIRNNDSHPSTAPQPSTPNPQPPQVTDGTRVLGVSNGVELLTIITAAGCSVTALIAAFLAVAPKGAEMEATAAALSVFGLAGEIGLANAPRPGPGSLRVGLLDALHLMTEAEVLAGAKVQEQ